MHEALDVLEAALPDTDPTEAYLVTHEELASAVRVIARADDSSGVVGDACRRLLDLHPKVAASAGVSPAKLVDWMITFQFGGDVDYFELDPVAYAPALGDTGMKAYRARLDAVDRPVDDDASEAAVWGSALEAVVARKVSTRHPELGRIAPRPGLIAHDEHPWMLATLDRLLMPRRTRNARPTCALEVVQAQQQLAVTGFDHLYVAVLVGGQHMPTPYRVERDDDAIAAITDFAAAWWDEHVVGHVPPPLTLADRSILTAVYPGDVELDPLVADDTVLGAFADYVDARRRRDEAIGDMDRSGFVVKNAMGDRTALTDHLGTVLATWKPTKTSRSFRVKE